VIISGFAMGVHKPIEIINVEESLKLEMIKVSGDDKVFTHEYNEWGIEIIISNLGENTFFNIVVTATLPAEINCIGYLFLHGTLEIIEHGKGKSGAKEVRWTIESLEAHQKLTLSLQLCTTKNPAGLQEFTSAGEYIIIKGAELTCAGVSIGPTEPLIVIAKDKVKEPEIPEIPWEPKKPKEPDIPKEPEPPKEPNPPEKETMPVKIDVLFLIDSTGSMSDEIHVVKVKIEEIIYEVRNGTPKPDVRYAIVTYRDRGDAYITKSFDFTEDLDEIKTFLYDIYAQGGGDGPESVNEGLHVAINDCDWGGKDHVKMIFLIGDAPPHMDYEDDFDYREEIKIAKQKQIKVHTIGCSGITSYTNGESIFKEIAEKTGGTYQELIYSSSGGGYTIGKSGYSDGFSRSKYYYPVLEDSDIIYRMPTSRNFTYEEKITFEETSVSCLDYYDIVDDSMYFGRGDSVSFSTTSYTSSSSYSKDSNNCGNLLDVQLTYVIQQEAIKNGVSYDNAVSLPGE
jgi:Mg-chelatase subunit ChlD